MKHNYIYILVIFFTSSIFAQFNNIAIGGGIGLGNIQGNIPSQTSFAGKVFIETNASFKPFNKIEFAFTYAQKLEKILPENNIISYYPFVKSFTIAGKSNQQLNNIFFIEEGLGLLLLNDRTFSDTDTWNYGFVLNVSGGTNLSNNTEIQIGLDYGLTLNNTNASYLLFLVTAKYNL